MQTPFDDLVKMGAMSQAEAESLSALNQALDLIEGIGPRIERDRERDTGECDPIQTDN